jgi:hypothetical protein
VKQFGIGEVESDDEAEVPADMMKAKDLTFETNVRGHFILPPLESLVNIKQRQRVVRGYIGAVYRKQNLTFNFHLLTIVVGKFTGYKKAAFPYLLAAKDGQNVYSPECVPANFSLGDPDHLTGFKISSLYNHWLSRQQKKLQPFIVLNAGPLHHTLVSKTEKPKGKKRKLEYVPVSSNEPSDEGEKEEGSDNARNDVPPLKFGPPGAGQSKPYNPKSRTGGVNKAKVRDSFLLCSKMLLFIGSSQDGNGASEDSPGGLARKKETDVPKKVSQNLSSDDNQLY